jgi:hypothetical protein
MESANFIDGASPRAKSPSQELRALIRARRSHDPGLGVPDALAALELAKASLLEESGVTAVGRRLIVAVAGAVLLATGLMLFLMSR